MSDPVADDVPGTREIGFVRSEHANCSSILWDNLERNPDKLAVISSSSNLTYRELTAVASMWGNAFKAAGLVRQDRIACLLDDTPVYPAVFFGAVRAGFVPVLLNTQTKPDVLNYYLRDSEARLVVTEASLSDQFTKQTLDGTCVEKIIAVDEYGDGSAGLKEFLKDQPTRLNCADTEPDEMAFWMYSSGTTGQPKGIVHLHHDMAYTHQSFGLNVLKLSHDDICFSVPKIFFAYGFGNSLTFPFSVGATALLASGRPRSDAVLDTIEKFRPTVFFGLPTLYNLLCRDESIGSRNLTSIRQSISAAETLSEEIYNTWQELTGHGITEGLGSTELLHIYLSNRHDDHRTGAAGARVAGYEIRLVSPEGDNVGAGEEGIMLVRGHSSTPGYWRQPEKTAETVRGEWIYTGDRFLQRDGYYYFQGRADDLVKISGQWVWPLEVERCLNDHPDVHESAVMAQELSDKRMTLRAVICLKDGVCADDDQTRLLQDHVRNHLMPFKYPRVVEYRKELPKTGTGKIDRQALLEEC
ncbi:MAG: benzoate-CoA ligase family protein [Acidiferrobacterales bacterium]|nr:benzoate-CoA ligase family protein [Acidiferrobacterales bacterium]